MVGIARRAGTIAAVATVAFVLAAACTPDVGPAGPVAGRSRVHPARQCRGIADHNRWYAVTYEGLDPVTAREIRRWQAAGTDKASAERLARRLAAN